MTLDLEQQALRDTARDFLDKTVPVSLHRQLIDSPGGFSETAYQAMADLYWFGLLVPEEFDGMDASLGDMGLILEEMGRVCLTGPFLSTAVVGASILEWAGTEDQKQAFLPKIAAGEIYTSLAIAEAAGTLYRDDIHTVASEHGSGFRISGTKLFVPDASESDFLLVVCRVETPSGASSDDGTRLLMVDTDVAGVGIRPMDTIGLERCYKVVFDNVVVPQLGVIGAPGDAWATVERALSHAAVALSAYMVGGAQRVLEMATSYAQQRIQFGKPIGSFQAIQIRCADMAIEVDAARSIVTRAIQALEDDDPAAESLASAAKAWTSEAFIRVVAAAHRVHGAVGFSSEFDLQFFTRTAESTRTRFGDPEYHRQRISRHL